MFELLNVKWGEPTFGTPSGQVTWSSELNGDLPIEAGFDLDDMQDSLRAAFEAWENVSAVDFVEVATGGVITVSNGPLDWPTVGLAGPFPVDRGEFFSMSSADIIFSDTLMNPETGNDFTWSPFGVSGTVDFFAVAVHEIGHVIGLDHPNDPTQIMNAIVGVDDLGTGDIQGAQFLYGTDGDDVELEPGFPENAVEVGLAAGSPSGDDGGGGGSGAGLLLGLLALLAAFFTGGASLGLAAGQVALATDDDEPTDDPDPFSDIPEMNADELAALFNAHDHCHYIGEDGMVYHGVSVAGFLPSVDFTQQPNPCGCMGLCEHILDQDEPSPPILLI